MQMFSRWHVHVFVRFLRCCLLMFKVRCHVLNSFEAKIKKAMENAKHLQGLQKIKRVLKSIYFCIKQTAYIF